MNEASVALDRHLTSSIAEFEQSPSPQQLRESQSMTQKIEIKGLGGTVQRARDAISQARRASSDLETAAAAFALDADEITAQVKQHHDDLLFEAMTLGNSQPSEKTSGEVAGKPNESKTET